MQSFFQKAKASIISHKKTSVLVAIAILLIAFFVYKTLSSATGETSYALGTVEKGTIVSSITGSGQVSAENEIDLKAKSTGTITYVGVRAGQVVRKGQTLFALDSSAAKRAVRNAETDLETAQLDLEKFKKAPDDTDVLALKNSTADAEQSKINAQAAVDKAHRDLMNSSVAAISTNTNDSSTPPTISGTYEKNQEGVITITTRPTGTGAYFSALGSPDSIVNGTGTVSAAIPQPIGDTGLYIKFTSPSQLGNWTIALPNKSAPAYAENLRAYTDAVTAQETAIRNADLTIAQNAKKLADLYQPDALDLRAKELVVQQKEDALADAKESLSDTYVVSPFDGTISSVTGKLQDTASGTLATIVTNDEVVDIPLNEVDISKVHLGDRATFTFDAIEGLTLTGKVGAIDTVGTVTQGVVNYTVTIGFDSPDSRVKPGMSATASIITDAHQDVLMVPSAAVKSGASGSYVLSFAQTPTAVNALGNALSAVPPQQIPVTIGISDDSITEIISGLVEGQQIVTKTVVVAATTAKSTTAAPSLLGGGTGGSRAAGGTASFRSVAK